MKNLFDYIDDGRPEKVFNEDAGMEENEARAQIRLDKEHLALNMPPITRETQEKVVKQWEKQGRLKIYRPER